MVIKTLSQAHAYLQSLTPSLSGGLVFGLDRIRFLLNALGSPETHFPSVLVGGTSGKGSTCAILASMAKASGLKVGSTVSPHLQDVRERIQLQGRPIGKAEFIRAVERLRLANTKVAQRHSRFGPPTYFESLTALAFDQFAKWNVDLAVVEVGLGGRCDATNILDPLVTIITNVEKDHEHLLGHSFAAIAREKGGIIKPGTPILTNASRSAALRVLTALARQRKAPLRRLQKEFKILKRSHESSPSLANHRQGQEFDFQNEEGRIQGLQLTLNGDHQLENAALALDAAFQLRKHGPVITEKGMRAGLTRVFVPGRFEIIDRKPLVILDGAHNPHKMAALARALEKYFPKIKRHVVFAVKKKKNAQAMFRRMLPLAQTLILTDVQVPSSNGQHRVKMQSTHELRLLARRLRWRGKIIEEFDPRSAVTAARQMAGKRDLILVTGSLYLVGAVRPYLKR